MKIPVLAVLYLWSMTATALSEGDLAPPFSLPILGTSQLVELADFNGKILYLDFWASWCGPCRISLPKIVELQAELGSDQFEVIAINLDENQDNGTRFLRRFPVNYTVLSDPQGEVAEAYQLPGMPTSFIVGRTGKISLKHVGFKQGDMAMIRSRIQELLSQDE